MGDRNQLEFVRRHRDELPGPYFEIGSKDYGSTQDLRALFPGEEYVGVDLEPGDGVDRVLDLAEDFESVDRTLGGARFGTVFCLSVLEHCEQPFVVADNLTRLLRPGGKVVISAPFSWIYHAFPGDYWRFTHQGIRKLFPGLDFDHPGNHLATAIDGDEHPLDEELGRIRLRGGSFRARGMWWRGFFVDLLRFLPPYRWLTRHRNLLPMCLVNMIGVLPAQEESAGS